jgi:hypothetical protein
MTRQERGPHAGHVVLAAAVLALFIGVLPLQPPHAAPVSGAEPAPQSTVRPAPVISPIFVRGEQLTWEVSYLTIKLGSISSRIMSIDTVRGRIHVKAECLIRSYKGVPFVTLHTLFQSTMNDSLASISFATREHIADTTNKYINYTYGRRYDVMYISERIGDTPVPENYDTLSLDGKRWQDGLSLLFFARARARSKAFDRVPVIIYRTKATTTIRNTVAVESVDIDAVDYPVRTVKIDGDTGFTGIFGLTGGFEGWFSDDAAGVPIKAKMHVLIGSVTLELIRWKRPGWGPPRAT